jgi:hypothetical protein
MGTTSTVLVFLSISDTDVAAHFSLPLSTIEYLLRHPLYLFSKDQKKHRAISHGQTRRGITEHLSPMRYA